MSIFDPTEFLPGGTFMGANVTDTQQRLAVVRDHLLAQANKLVSQSREEEELLE